MAGMHALHKILANCARPQRASFRPAREFPGRRSATARRPATVGAGEACGRTLQAQPLPESYRAMIQAGGEKLYLKARLAADALRRGVTQVAELFERTSGAVVLMDFTSASKV